MVQNLLIPGVMGQTVFYICYRKNFMFFTIYIILTIYINLKKKATKFIFLNYYSGRYITTPVFDEKSGFLEDGVVIEFHFRKIFKKF